MLKSLSQLSLPISPSRQTLPIYYCSTIPFLFRCLHSMYTIQKHRCKPFSGDFLFVDVSIVGRARFELATGIDYPQLILSQPAQAVGVPSQKQNSVEKVRLSEPSRLAFKRREEIMGRSIASTPMRSSQQTGGGFLHCCFSTL